MKLEQQVVSLELAKKMKELGAPQGSLFYWLWNRDEELSHQLCGWYDDQRSPKSAYTVAELGEMLPASLKGRGPEVYLRSGRQFKAWDKWMAKFGKIVEVAETEANARAKMWIYLKENNLI